MTAKNTARCSGGQEGFALVAALLLTMMIAGLGIALVLDATAESWSNGNFRGSLQAFYVARSGLEEARARIPILGASPISLPSGVGNVTYIVHDSGVNPRDSASVYYDAEYAAEFPGTTPVVAPLVTSIQPSAINLPYQWVRITMKTEVSSAQDINRDSTLDSSTPVYWDGTQQNLAAAGKPVYKITALAVLPGGSRSILQMEGSEPPPYSADAAIASQDEVKLQGNFSVSGIDFCGQTDTVYGVKTTMDINTAGHAGTVAGLTGPSPNNPGTYGNAPGTYDIAVLINSLKAYATPIQQVDTTVSYNAGSGTYSGSNVTLGVPPPNPPPAGSNGTPAITYAAGNLSVSSNNSKGCGILIVDGDMNVNGGLYYYGLIVVRGIVSFTGGGSNSVNIQGAIVSGSSLVNSSNVGGGVNVIYNSCAIKNPYNAFPLKMLAFREIVNY